MNARAGRRCINLGLFATGVASAASGLLIQARYHIGHGRGPGEAGSVGGWSYPAWALVHQIASGLLLGLVTWHLYLNRKALLAVLTRNGAWRRQGPILVVLFALAVLTALSALSAGISDDHVVEHRLVEIHDKVVLPVSILLALHVWTRRSRLV